jgi:hypothetical protein
VKHQSQSRPEVSLHSPNSLIKDGFRVPIYGIHVSSGVGRKEEGGKGNQQLCARERTED